MVNKAEVIKEFNVISEILSDLVVSPDKNWFQDEHKVLDNLVHNGNMRELDYYKLRAELKSLAAHVLCNIIQGKVAAVKKQVSKTPEA